MTKSIQTKLKKIKMLVMDVDGVLTDGSIVIGERGDETKVFYVQDGLGIVMMNKLGYKTAIITARAAKAVVARAKDLKIHKVFQDVYPKEKAYKKLLKDFKLKDEQVCYIGDDIPDYAVIKRAGLGVSVPNGVAEVKRVADYITKKPGGGGAVREVIDMILKAQGTYKEVKKHYGMS